VKVIPALLLAVAAGVLAGCGPGSAAPPVNAGSARGLVQSIAARTSAAADPQNTPGTPVRFRDIEYYALVNNAGAANSFTAFATLTRSVTVQPSSAARIDVTGDGSPVFTTPGERTRWQAAGSPVLTNVPPGGQAMSFPSGEFSFTPQGTTLTYQQAASLPASPDGVSAALLAHLKGYVGTGPPATLILTELGFLLASAPLPTAARSAAWDSLASLPGLRLCGSGTDLAGRPGRELCADDDNDETRLLVDAPSGTVLAVEDRIRTQSPLYPGVPAGSLIGSDTFVVDGR
jgi:hypothetical protein